MIKKILLCSFFSISTLPNAWADANHELGANVKADLANNILTEKEVYEGADLSSLLYEHCIGETTAKLKTMYPNIDQKQLIRTLNESCEYSEDRYGIYNILLASMIVMKKPLSEQQAAMILEKEYLKIGRDKANAKQRKDIYKRLGII